MKAKIFVLLLLLTGAQQSIASSLDRWLGQVAEPGITAFIESSPRFVGESVAVKVMVDGRVGIPTNLLEEKVARRLTEILVQQARVRVPLTSGAVCSPDNPNLVLAVEIVPDLNMRHRVTLAFIDQGENTWINGSPLSWTGRLSQSERRELQVVDRGQVLHEGQSGAIAQALIEGVGCTEEFAIPVFLESELVTLRQEVEGLLKDRTLITHNPGIAGTHLRLGQKDAIVKLEMLREGQPILLTQVQLAANSESTPASSKLQSSEWLQPLLTSFEIQDRRQYCKSKPGCVDVAYEVSDRAYVVEFLTLNGKVLTKDCGKKLRSERSGKSFGLNVPASGNPDRPSLGYYLLATSDRQVAESLRGQLTRGQCAGRGVRPDISSIAVLVAESGVEWKAMHLVNYRGNVTRLRGGAR